MHFWKKEKLSFLENEGIFNFSTYQPFNLNTMLNKNLPEQVVTRMMQKDLFSQWLGIQIIEVNEGYSKLKMVVRKEMINGFDIVHGGIAFSLADTAFAFACNNRNNLSVALDTSINFLKPVHPGDELIAEAKEIHNGKSTGLYHVTITNQHNHVVALFKGTCFRTQKNLV